MEFRPTEVKDINSVMNIINQAKEYFKSKDIDQWQDGYPNEDTILNDINKNEAYVLVDNDKVIGTCMVTINGEPNYNNIDGKWILNSPYICVHRIAIDNNYKGNGLASIILDNCIQLYPGYHSVRIDTHNDNLSMQAFLTKYGFVHCGTIILLDSGAPRRAYEKRI